MIGLLSSILFLVLVTFILFKKTQSLRVSFITSIVLLYFFSFITVELLSIFSLLHRTSIILVSLGMLGFLILYTFRFYSIHYLQEIFSSRFLKEFSDWKVMVSICILGILFIVGSYYPPNNWDSMTYHLARMGHWIQNESVDFYPTTIQRQNYLGPLAEYFLTVLFLFDQTETFLFFSQWLSLLGILAVVSLLVQKISTKDTGAQKTSLLVVLFIPLTLFQSVTTQNDLVVSFFILSFFYFLFSKKSWFLISLTFVLALLTKMIAIFYLCIPLLYWFRIQWKEKNYRKVFLFFTVVCFFYFPHAYRNVVWYKHPLGIQPSHFIVSNLLPQYVLVNGFKNISLQFQTPYRTLNSYTMYFVKGLGQLLHVDLNDDRIRYENQNYTISINFFDHDDAGAVLYVLLTTLMMCFYFYKKGKPKFEKRYVLLVAIGAMFVIFMFAWQVSATRFQLPLLLLLSPIVAVHIKHLGSIEKYILAVMTVFSLWLIWNNYTHPLSQLGQFENIETSRYRKKRGLYNEYTFLTQYITANKIHTIGVITNGDDWEYPLWYYLYKQSDDFKMNHMLKKSQYHPKIIIDIRDDKQYSIDNRIDMSLYYKLFNFRYTHVYTKIDERESL